MIAFLEGRLAEVTGNVCVLLTDGGVGFSVALPGHTLASLPAKGERVALHTSLMVREDALDLYGFATLEERQTFEVLVTLPKVGAKTALSVLSVFRPADLRTLVANDSATPLTQVPGIGKKSAERIFLELKDKLKAVDGPLPMAAGGGSAPADFRRSVLDGLLGLGYSEEEAWPVVQNLFRQRPDIEVSEALRSALKELGSGGKK